MYLIRTRKKGSKQPEIAHIWDGVDTLCTMHSTGGLRAMKYYRVAETAEGRPVCRNCALAGTGQNLNNRFRAAMARDKD